MSAETKQAAKQAGDYAKRATEYLQVAKEHAAKVPDKDLQQKVEKALEQSKEIKKHVDEKLGEK